MSPDKKIGVGFGVMLIKGGKVLLGKRNSDPEKASSLLHGEGTWTMPGGKLHFGEAFEDAAYREVFEETGIKIDKLKLKFISITNDLVEDAHFVTVCFLTEDFQGDARIREPEEITEWKWFSTKNPPSPLYSPSEKVLKNFNEKVIYKN